MDPTNEEDALRQALLSPSTPESPSVVARSFNETSFSFSNFLLGRNEPSPRRSVIQIMDDDFNEDSSLFQYSKTVKNYRALLLMLTVICLWPLGFHSFIRFQRDTESSFSSVPGSPSKLAQDAFTTAYAENDFMDPMHPALVLVLKPTTRSNITAARELTHNGTVAYLQGHNFSTSLLPFLNSRCWRWPDTAKDACVTEEWLRVTSFYSVMDDDLQWIARGSLVAGSSALLQVEYTLPANESKHHKRRVLELMDAVDEYKNSFWKDLNQNKTDHHFSVHYTGLKYFSSDLALSTRHDLMRMDIIVLPLALILMGIVLPAANPAAVWMVPVITILSTVSCWAILMRFVASHYMQISTFTPTVMMSLTLGMGIDYTMFLLARYLEEMRAGSSRKRAVLRMLSGSGHVLVLSGLTLACVFGGLAFLPLSMLKSIGVGASTAILSSLVVNLTLVPALLFTPLGLWIISEDEPSGMLRDEAWQPTSSFLDETPVREPDHPRQPSDIPSPPFPRESIWFSMSKHLLHPYRGIIILLVTCQLLLPIARHAGSIKSSISFDLLLPAKSPSLQTFHDLSDQIGPGSLNPYRILFDGHATNTTMTSDVGFEVMHLVLDELQAIDHPDEALFDSATRSPFAARGSLAEVSSTFLRDVDNDCANDTRSSNDSRISKKPNLTTYNGIAAIKNRMIPHALFVSAKYCSQLKPHCPVELLHVIDAVDKQVTSQDLYATYMTATLAFNPFSDEGVEWLMEARATIGRLEKAGALSGVSVYMEGSAGIAHDAVDSVYSAFPTMVLTTTVVVFVLMGLFFKSAFPPIRSIVSISLTLAFSFGLSVLVFQNGVLDWVHLRTLTSIGDEVCWLVPIMAFSIVVGLALDYDVFLISRILEYRLDGYEHRSSVALGLDATGGIITAAGVIMAVAFGSLMFSSNPVLYQWSFVLTTSVLLDTFVIRTLVVPILIGLAGKHCWWPRRLPNEQICFAEFIQGEPDDVAGLLRSLESTSEYEPLSLNR